MSLWRINPTWSKGCGERSLKYTVSENRQLKENINLNVLFWNGYTHFEKKGKRFAGRVKESKVREVRLGVMADTYTDYRREI